MSNQKRNNYSSEFRSSSIKLALESEQPISHTARNLGININTLHTWIRNQSNSKESNNMVKNSECHFDEVRKLKKELSIVKQERDLLKKAAAYFAKESQ
ncbi:transposase [Rickettsiales bacterium]|nr:transposase [Rickettsiales bacterium]MDB2550915.1 transposase [Rickettsiales bacterium]